jgi:hypothetical protein
MEVSSGNSNEGIRRKPPTEFLRTLVDWTTQVRGRPSEDGFYN